jgi:hypothetical protein
MGSKSGANSMISHPALHRVGFAKYHMLPCDSPHSCDFHLRNCSDLIAGLFTFDFAVSLPILRKARADKTIIVSVALSVLCVCGAQSLPLEVTDFSGARTFLSFSMFASDRSQNGLVLKISDYSLIGSALLCQI